MFVVDPLKAKGARVYIFGSRARGQHHPFSDIDILFTEAKPNTLMPADISQIKESVENSLLAIKVDLVNQIDLAKSYQESVQKDLIEIS